MHHGLAVGMFMMIATLVGIWLWQTKVLRKVKGIPMPVLVAFLLATFVMLKSSGAYVLLMIGVLILLVGRQFKVPILAYVVIAGVCGYLYISAGGNTDVTHQITEFLSKFFDEERMQSLTFRFQNEEILTARARLQVVFGWGGWGRSLIYDANGKQAAIQDSLWILMFGQYGMVGLVSLFSLLMLPIASLLWSRLPASTWGKPEQAPAAVLAIALNMYVVDCLLNAMINPLYILVAGGLAGLAVSKPERIRSRSKQSLQTGVSQPSPQLPLP
jgi:chromate transport protein ChrA